MSFKHAFSLIELMVACSIVAIVLVSVIGIFGFAVRQWNYQIGTSTAMEEANLAADMMSKEISTGVQWTSNTLVLPANTDSAGNYVPASANGSKVVYASGTEVEYYLSNSTGTATSGTDLWRMATNSFSLWKSDTVWSCLPGGVNSGPKFPNVTGLSILQGASANNITLSVTVSFPENGQLYAHTATRNVYLSNHN
jgi:prepilin-type N-terminal cleavage/methylation domain-containing protein